MMSPRPRKAHARCASEPGLRSCRPRVTLPHPFPIPASPAISSATRGNCHGIEDADAPNRVRYPCQGLTGRCQHCSARTAVSTPDPAFTPIGHHTISDVGITVTHNVYAPMCAAKSEDRSTGRRRPSRHGTGGGRTQGRWHVTHS
jgi:hypothetical protein